MENKNKATLEDFVKYCEKNPELRFWQALRNWSNHGFVGVADHWDDESEDGIVGWRDTYYWEGKDE